MSNTESSNQTERADEVLDQVARWIVQEVMATCRSYSDLVEAERREQNDFQNSSDVAVAFLISSTAFLTAIACVDGIDALTAKRIRARLERAADLIEARDDDAAVPLPDVVSSYVRAIDGLDVTAATDCVVGFARVVASGPIVYPDQYSTILNEAVVSLRYVAGLLGALYEGEATGKRRIEDAGVLDGVMEYVEGSRRQVRIYAKRAADENLSRLMPLATETTRKMERLGVIDTESHIPQKTILAARSLIVRARDALPTIVTSSQAALPPALASALISCCAAAEGMARSIGYDEQTLIRTASLLRRAALMEGIEAGREAGVDLADMLGRAVAAVESENVVEVARTALALSGMAGSRISDATKQRLTSMITATAEGIAGLIDVDPTTIDGPEAAGRLWVHCPELALPQDPTRGWTEAFVRGARELDHGTIRARFAVADSRVEEVVARYGAGGQVQK